MIRKMQSIDSVETYVYGTSKDLVSEKEEIKCNNITEWYKKTINFDDVVKENMKKHNLNWWQNSDHPYRIVIETRDLEKQIHYLN